MKTYKEDLSRYGDYYWYYAAGERRAEERGIALGEQRGITIGEQRGIALGSEKTRKEHQVNVALKLAKRGWTIIEIADFTDLPIEEVKNILKQNNLL
jgi:predicted transposase YdaD